MEVIEEIILGFILIAISISIVFLNASNLMLIVGGVSAFAGVLLLVKVSLNWK